MDLKNAENRIKKYLKLAKLERNHLNAKIVFFSELSSLYNGEVYFTFWNPVSWNKPAVEGK